MTHLQYLACKFRPADSRTYTYSWDGETPLAPGDKVQVDSPRDEGRMTIEVAAIVPKPSFPTKPIIGKAPEAVKP